MLSFNNASTIARALESLSDIEEVIVGDGGSTDGTRDIVLGFGRTLVDQPESSRGPDGRLVDYGSARDHVRGFATQPWVIQLDSDEYAHESLIADLRRVCVDDGDVDLYSVEARYEVAGRLVDCATTYPMSFPRLFRASACSGYSGRTHERAVVQGEPVPLQSYFVIPFPATWLMLRKWSRYLRIDHAECRSLELPELRERAAHGRSQIRWFFRDFRTKRIRPACVHPLPLHSELLRLGFYVARYGIVVAEGASRGLRRRSAEDARRRAPRGPFRRIGER